MKSYGLHFLCILVTATMLGPSSASMSWQESLLQNDLLAALSWALFDIDPYSALPPYLRNSTNSTGTVTEFQEQERSLGSYSPSSDSSLQSTSTSNKTDSPGRESLDYLDPLDGLPKNRNLFFTFQGKRPRVRIELRMLKLRLFTIYERTALIFFLGTGASAFLDDVFRIKERGYKQDTFLSSLEDIVSMLGVDGPSCVHRMLCEMGSAPALRTSGLFGELLDITVRHVLAQDLDESSNDVEDLPKPQYSDDSPYDGSDSPISYLDAVAAGRLGANCAHTFHQCPMSLLSMMKFVQDFNSE